RNRGHAVNQPRPGYRSIRFEFIVYHYNVRLDQNEMTKEFFYPYIVARFFTGIRPRCIPHSICKSVSFREIPNHRIRFSTARLSLTISQHTVCTFRLLIPSRTVRVRHRHLVTRPEERTPTAVKDIK